MTLALREHQVEALEQIKQGFDAGHTRQLLYAPTGAGKTEMAIALMQEYSQGYQRSAMVMDRIVLVEQTSLRLGKYKIDHGVLQAGHWRYQPSQRIQICSIQTLARRGKMQTPDLLFYDECHVNYKSVIDYINENPSVKVVGLSATPFTKGLAGMYTNVVSAVPTEKLIEKGFLCPLKVYIAKEIDMTGAKKIAGEWSAAEVSDRGMKITGDIVAEWVKKTHEIFGAPRKTVVFCSGVEHGRDLAKQFADAGYNFVSISYKEDDEFKRLTIEDFSKPDTKIHGLIATDILTKGFDVSDVMIGISARPFSKSLSSHIQQLGRVLRSHEGKSEAIWLCIAKGSRVLTDKGLVAIDKITLAHKIWDGANFVNHSGAVCNGNQRVITYQGLTATPGHLVHTAQGWRTFGDCAREQIRITQTGFGQLAIRISEDMRPTSFLVGRKAQAIHARFVRVCDLWLQKLNLFAKLANRKNQGMQSLQSAGTGVSNVALQQSSIYASQMLLKIKQSICSLWCKRSGIQIFGGQARNRLDHGQSWYSKLFFNSRSFAHTVGSNRPLRALRTGKFAMAFSGDEPTKQKGQSMCCADAQVSRRSSPYSLFRQHSQAFLLGWHDSRTNNRALSQAFSETEREVWDILDAGQHNRFTCEGLLVHNCHSGNYLRFRNEWDDVYSHGVTELKPSGEVTKKEPTEKEKKESTCPKCKALWMGGDICGACGYVRVRMSTVESVPGELKELQAANKKLRIDNQSFYSQLIHFAQAKGYKSGWAYHKYKEKFNVAPNGLSSAPEQPSSATLGWIKSRTIAFAKAKSRSA